MNELEILLYRGNSLISKVIRWVTKSPFTHSAVTLDDYHLIEINWYYRLKIRHLKYRTGDYEVYVVKGITEEQKRKVKEFLLTHLGTKYDHIQSITHGLNEQTNGLVPIINDLTKYNCTEVLDLAFAYAGIDFLPSEINGEVLPGELSKSVVIERRK